MSVILGIVVVLSGNHFYSIMTPVWLLKAGNPVDNLVLSYPAAIIHLDTNHLAGNVFGYLAAGVLGYYLCSRAGVARWYYVSFVAILVVVPPVSTYLTYNVFQTLRPDQAILLVGFSNVVGGLIGFLFVAMIAYLSSVYSLRSVGGMAVISVVGSVIEVLVVDTIGSFVAVVLGLAIGVIGFVIVRMVFEPVVTDAGAVRNFSGHLFVFGSVFGIHSLLLVGILPRFDLMLGVSVVAFGHLVGLFLGVIIGLVFAIVFGVFPTRRHVIELGFDPDATLEISMGFLVGLIALVGGVSWSLYGVMELVSPGDVPLWYIGTVLVLFGMFVVGGWCLVVVVEMVARA